MSILYRMQISTVLAVLLLIYVDDVYPQSIFDSILEANQKCNRNELKHNHRGIFVEDIDDERSSNNGEGKLFEGDIVFTKDIQKMVKGEESEDELRDALNRGQWPNGVIPYTIAKGEESRLAGPVKGATAKVEKQLGKGCVKWTYHTEAELKKKGTKNYVTFYKGGGCSSNVGMQRGPQKISIGNGCESTGVIMHEMMHAMGFFHEQSRLDRDKFIKVHYDNIRSGTEGNFRKYRTGQASTLGEPYDIKSIMQYSYKAFSKNGQPTITSRVKDVPDREIGQRKELTQIDVNQLRKYYNCKGGTGTETGTGTGTKPPTPGPNGLRCEGKKKCCTKRTPCTLGDGDCNKDKHCKGDLTCGKDNCKWNQEENKKDDCCEAPTKPPTPGPTTGPNGLRCEGKKKCCKKRTPCTLGDGYCKADKHCKGDLVCGKDNCKFNEGNKKGDCCQAPTTPSKDFWLRDVLEPRSTLRCEGKKKCCKKRTPCTLGDGDCNKDNHCEGDLVCGKDNCKWNAEQNKKDDCCKAPTGPPLPSPGPTGGLRCDGKKRCCKKRSPCTLGDGDCNRDTHCEGDLTCGKDNCKWNKERNTKDDCCQAPTGPQPTSGPGPIGPNGLQCGKKGVTEGRIVGGKDALEGEWPWQIGMFRASGGPLPFCGGTLIRPNVVLTAAHCISTSRPSFYSIRVGDWSLKTKGDDELSVDVKEIIVHEKYKGASSGDDIALIILKSSVKLKKAVNVACLPQSCEITGDCFATGWGTLSSGGRRPTILQEVALPVVPSDTCKKVYRSLTSGMLCAGLQKGGKDSCQGDSGGPFVCQKKNTNTYEVRGITSFGRGCASANAYGVYTNVCKYTDWIGKKLQSQGIKDTLAEIRELESDIFSEFV